MLRAELRGLCDTVHTLQPARGREGGGSASASGRVGGRAPHFDEHLVRLRVIKLDVLKHKGCILLGEY